jgi:DNA-binding transcriptional ArsR family regulator
MNELLMPTEGVRELTTTPRRIPIEIEGSVSHEVILTIWSVFSPKDTGSGQDLGEEWAEKVTAATPEDLREELVILGGPWFYVWLSISSFLLSAPHPHDPDRMFDWLESVDEMRLRRWILSHTSHKNDQALIEQSANGDLDALLQLMDHGSDDVKTDDAKKKEAADVMVAFAKDVMYTEGLPNRYATALKRFRSEVFDAYEDEFGGAIERAAAARRAAPTRGNAVEVIEEVTSGISFDIPLGVTRVVLVPSVVTRPLSLIDGSRGTLVVYFGVADEFINGDPEAPPSWLVNMFKALSDEKRLRILRRLGEGVTTLDELTELLSLSKSTVHHHIGQLRAAGLIRVHMDNDESKTKQRHYSLRPQSLTEARAFLDSYLSTSEEEQDA